VAVVPGDLSQPGFGLDDDAIAELARRVDAIVHNGARVHHLYDYGHLRATNVGGTREVLRLARLAGDVPVRYVSSISTSLELRDGRLAERANAELEPQLGSGYGESKWVAERMVLAAGEQGIPVQAIRLPRAMTALHSGATSTNDAAVHLLRGCIELGAYPQWSGWEPWAPVDLLGDVLGSDPFDFGNATGIAYPPATIASFTRMFRGAAEYGFALQPVPLADWRDQLGQGANHNPAIAVAAEFGLTDDAEAHAFGDIPPGRGWSLQPQLEGPASPPVDSEYVWRMLDYLVSVGYLSHPDTQG
jgi:nonribosomal peptide synthetase MxcG